VKVLCADPVAGVVWEEAPAPEPAAGELQIAAACSLVSPGTELHYIERTKADGRRLRLGYCSSGHVEALGPQIPAGGGGGGFAVGDRVIAMGWGYAWHAEVIRVPYRLCVKVPDGLPFERAVFANLAATALHAVHRAGLGPEDEVLVVGAGLVGQLVAQVAAGTARRVLLADRAPARLATAAALGLVPVAVPAGGSLRQAVEAIAGPAAVAKIFLCVTGDATAVLAEAVALLAARNRGGARGVLVGVGRFTAEVAFDVEMGNLDIRFAARCGAGYRDDDYVHGRTTLAAPPGEATVDANLAASLDLVARDVLRPAAMDVLRLGFNEAPAAYPLLARREAPVAALFEYEQGAAA
jgi:threonine dehydrogenase-like Zn-dependent dehydrogenase